MKTIKIITISISCMLLAVMGYAYNLYAGHSVSTDDAYVAADIADIAARITGHVTQVLVTHNQQVKKGQLLFTIDKQPFELAVAMAQQKLIYDQTELSNAKLTDHRMQQLVRQHFIPTEKADASATAVEQLEAVVKLDQINIQKLQLDLRYTDVKAPISGWVSNISLVAGDEVTQDQPVFSIISDQKTYVVANFKENQIEHLHEGQAVTIHSDSYPGHAFKGEVDSLSHGTGNAFALIPSENATGNWVKVVQRLPVRIRVINDDPQYLLRVGTSASVKVEL